MAYTKDFEAWWGLYPRKIGKKAASRAFGAAVRDVMSCHEMGRVEALEWLMEVTDRFAKSDKGRAGQYCPHPSTWLGQGRYDDDPREWSDDPPPPPRPKKQKSPEEIKASQEFRKVWERRNGICPN